MEYNISLPPIDDARDITQRYLQEHASDLPLLSTQVVTYTNPTKVILYRYDLIRNNSNTPDYNRIYFGTFVSLAPANEILLTTQIIDPSGSIQPIDTPLAASAQITKGDYVYEIFNYINAIPAEECYFVGYEFRVDFELSTNPILRLTVNKTSLNLVVEFDVTTFKSAINDTPVRVDFGDGTSQTFISTTGAIGTGIYVNHTYSSEGVYDIQIYSEANMKEFYADGLLYPTSQDITTFYVYDSNILDSFILRQNPLTNFEAKFFGPTAYIDLTTNNLIPNAVNNMLVQADSTGVYGGFLNTQNQTPPAPRTGSGLIAYNNLVNFKGWTVFTDV